MPCMMLPSALILFAGQAATSSANTPSCSLPAWTPHCVAPANPVAQTSHQSTLIAGYSVELNVASPEEYIANSTSPLYRQRDAVQKPLLRDSAPERSPIQYDDDAYVADLLDEPWSTVTVTHTHTAHATVYMTLPRGATVPPGPTDTVA